MTAPTVLLAGGVGGAKLAHGLQARLGTHLDVIVNTADDTERHGLAISPDHDTVMYTLAGIDNREWGWGITGETFAAAAMLERYGEETWFRLGDRDLATHIVRTARLRRGDRPTDIARDLQRALGVRARILPMTDAPVRTEVLTDEGWLEFQDYFVRRTRSRRCATSASSGIEEARSTPEVDAALEAAEAIVIAPSNPFVSVRPILVGRRGSRPVCRRRGAGASRSSPSRASSAGSRSRGPRTGCSCRSGTRRARSASLGSTRGSPTSSCSTSWTRRWSRPSASSGCGRS